MSSPNASHPNPASQTVVQLSEDNMSTRAGTAVQPVTPRTRIQILEAQVVQLQAENHYYRQCLREISDEYDDAASWTGDGPPNMGLVAAMAAHKAKRARHRGLWDFHMSSYRPSGFVDEPDTNDPYVNQSNHK